MMLLRLALLTALALTAGPASAQDDGRYYLNEALSIPHEYTMCHITIASQAVAGKPKTTSGRVIMFHLADPTGLIEIPWIDGLTAVESLRAWMGGER